MLAGKNFGFDLLKFESDSSSLLKELSPNLGKIYVDFYCFRNSGHKENSTVSQNLVKFELDSIRIS